jgi:hypothetical protein
MTRVISFLTLGLIFTCGGERSTSAPGSVVLFAESGPGPVNIQLFDSRSTNRTITLWWKAGHASDSMQLRFSPPPPEVSKVRIFRSAAGPDHGFALVHEDEVLEGSKSFGNLRDGTNYFFRLSAYSDTDTLVGKTAPIT